MDSRGLLGLPGNLTTSTSFVFDQGKKYDSFHMLPAPNLATGLHCNPAEVDVSKLPMHCIPPLSVIAEKPVLYGGHYVPGLVLSAWYIN